MSRTSASIRRRGTTYPVNTWYVIATKDEVSRQPLARRALETPVVIYRTQDGQAVAVKVQYPGVAEAVDTDLRNLTLLLPLVKRLAPGLDVKALYAELRERIAEELDYEFEAQNHRAVERAFRGHPFAHVPRVHTGLSSRRDVIE